MEELIGLVASLAREARHLTAMEEALARSDYEGLALEIRVMRIGLADLYVELLELARKL